MAPKAMKNKAVVSKSVGGAFQKALLKKPAARAAARTASQDCAGDSVNKKKPRTEAPQGSGESMEIGVTVLLSSGSQLAALPAQAAWTGAEVKAALSERLEAGVCVDGLLSGHKTFEDHQTVGEVSLGGSLELHAILAKAKPVLHLVVPCSAKALSQRHGGWCYGVVADSDVDGHEEEFEPDCFCPWNVMHRGMDTAPPAARQVAQELGEALAKDAVTGFDLVVIAGAGPDPQEACCRGLAIREEDRRMSEDGDELNQRAAEGQGLKIWKETEVSSVDVCSERVSGFEGVRGFEQLSASRQAMGRLLTGHFRFYFRTNDKAPKPMLLGGFAKDGSIVGFVTGDFW